MIRGSRLVAWITTKPMPSDAMILDEFVAIARSQL
jgi:hypothetical protein